MLEAVRSHSIRASPPSNGISLNDFCKRSIVNDLTESIPLLNQLAPEHVELCVDEAQLLAKQIRCAGSIFLGQYIAVLVWMQYTIGHSNAVLLQLTERCGA
ncbi:histidinol dehydrogenase [Nostoc sp.]|uniref:histidinol dehydrogenase n=1 Tax=Nostoc sp. TaxID=1180 RepID=UPI003FA551B9